MLPCAAVVGFPRDLCVHKLTNNLSCTAQGKAITHNPLHVQTNDVAVMNVGLTLPLLIITKQHLNGLNG